MDDNLESGAEGDLSEQQLADALSELESGDGGEGGSKGTDADAAATPEWLTALASDLHDGATVEQLVKEYTPEQLAALAMKDADYTKKTQAAARARDEVTALTAALDQRAKDLDARQTALEDQNVEAFRYLAEQVADGVDIRTLFVDDPDQLTEDSDMDDDAAAGPSKAVRQLQAELADVRRGQFERDQRAGMRALLDGVESVPRANDPDEELAGIRRELETGVWARYLASGAYARGEPIEDTARAVVKARRTEQKHTVGLLSKKHKAAQEQPRREGAAAAALRSHDLPLDKVDHDVDGDWASKFVAEGELLLAAMGEEDEP